FRGNAHDGYSAASQARSGSRSAESFPGSARASRFARPSTSGREPARQRCRRPGNIYELNTHGSYVYLTYGDRLRLYGAMGVGFGGNLALHRVVVAPRVVAPLKALTTTGLASRCSTETRPCG